MLCETGAEREGEKGRESERKREVVHVFSLLGKDPVAKIDGKTGPAFASVAAAVSTARVRTERQEGVKHCEEQRETKVCSEKFKQRQGKERERLQDVHREHIMSYVGDATEAAAAAAAREEKE